MNKRKTTYFSTQIKNIIIMDNDLKNVEENCYLIKPNASPFDDVRFYFYY